MTEFSQIQRQYIEQYKKKNFKEAMHLVEIAEQNHPGKIAETSFWKSVLYCCLGSNEKALFELKTAMAQGVWWGPELLLSIPDLKPLQNETEFKEILTSCETRLKEVQSQTKPETIVWPSKNSSVHPLIYSFHWRGDNINNFSSYWDDEELKNRYSMTFPQSSQLFAPEAFCWDDWKKSKDEIIETYQKVISNDNLHKGPLIVAGASQGGKLAVELALEENSIPAKGFILIVPAVGEANKYESMIKKALSRNLRGVVITGDQDPYFDEARGLCAAFEKYNFPYKLMISKGLGHSFPEDFRTRLIKAVDFILYDDLKDYESS